MEQRSKLFAVSVSKKLESTPVIISIIKEKYKTTAKKRWNNMQMLRWPGLAYLNDRMQKPGSPGTIDSAQATMSSGQISVKKRQMFVNNYLTVCGQLHQAL